MTNDQIREIFLAHGFTVKGGQTDLKPYVYAAARALIEAALKPGEPKCVAIIEVFGLDWRLEYLSLPVGRHKLYDQHYTYTTPPAQTPDHDYRAMYLKVRDELAAEQQAHEKTKAKTTCPSCEALARAVMMDQTGYRA